MGDTGTIEAYRIPSLSFLPVGKKTPWMTVPLGTFVSVSPHQCYLQLNLKLPFFFLFYHALRHFLLCFPPSAVHVSDLHQLHPCQCQSWKTLSPTITCLRWKLLTVRVTTGNQIPDNDWDCDLTPESGKTPLVFSGAGLHISVLLKLKQRADQFAHLNQDTCTAPCFAAAGSTYPEMLLCILDGLSSLQQTHRRAEGERVALQSPGSRWLQAVHMGKHPCSCPAPWASTMGPALPWTRAQALRAKLIAPPLSALPQQFTSCLSLFE